MRSAGALAVALSMLAGGCTTYAGSRKVAKVGGVMMLTGAAVAAIGVSLELGGEGGGYAPAGFGVLGLIAFVPGVVVGGAGLLGVVARRAAVAPMAAPHAPQDRDSDGFLDAADRCPAQPEDHDGVEDGCPSGAGSSW